MPKYINVSLKVLPFNSDQHNIKLLGKEDALITTQLTPDWSTHLKMTAHHNYVKHVQTYTDHVH